MGEIIVVIVLKHLEQKRANQFCKRFMLKTYGRFIPTTYG